MQHQAGHQVGINDIQIVRPKNSIKTCKWKVGVLIIWSSAGHHFLVSMENDRWAGFETELKICHEASETIYNSIS